MTIFKKFYFSVLFFAIFFLLLTVSASATLTRDMGTGLFQTPWMIDGMESIIFDNSAYLDKFKNRVEVEHIDQSSTALQDKINLDSTEVATFETKLNYGNNSGGIIWNPIAGFNVAVFSGLPLDAMWNSTTQGGFFHTGSVFTPTMQSSQAALLDPTIAATQNTIDLMDPDGNASGAGTATDIRNYLLQQSINLLFSYNFGIGSVGINFGYAASWPEKTYTAVSGDTDAYLLMSEQYSVGVSGLFNIIKGMDIDFSVGIKMDKISNTYSKTVTGVTTDMKYVTAGIFGAYSGDIDSSVGYNVELGKYNKLHAKIQYSYLDRSTAGSYIVSDNSINDSDIYTRTGHDIHVGVSDELKFLDGRIKTYFGINFEYKMLTYNYVADGLDNANDNTYNLSMTEMHLPFYVGVEAVVIKKYLTVRTGLSYDVYNPISGTSSLITTAGTVSRTESYDAQTPVRLSLGLSTGFDNFTLDWVINFDIITTGPDFISGYATSQAATTQNYTPLSMAFAVTYNFDSFLNTKEVDGKMAPGKSKKKKKIGIK